MCCRNPLGFALQMGPDTFHIEQAVKLKPRAVLELLKFLGPGVEVQVARD